MYTTLAEIQSLIGNISESNDLEFKRGDVLDNIQNLHVKEELIRDVSAFANSGGGTIIYGIAEDKQQTRFAAALSPTTNTKIDELQLTQLIRNGLDPLFNKFNVHCIDVPSEGKIFVISIDQADTAHQCKSDLKYYHRVGQHRPAMCDYEIRDVMNRRTAPLVHVKYSIDVIELFPDRHLYGVTPVLFNAGQVTANMWALEIILPASGEFGTQSADFIHTKGRLRTYPEHNVFEYSYDRTPSRKPARLLPGQSWNLGQSNGYPANRLTVTDEYFSSLSESKPSILFRLYVDNCRMQETQIPFDDWCKF